MSTTHAVVLHRHGGPEVLSYEDIGLELPGAHEVLIRQYAIGLNFIDVHHRTGRYPGVPPLVPGVEGAGIVEAVGSDVHDFAPGDRVIYLDDGPGAYAERRSMRAERLVPLRPEIPFDVGVGAMLKGLTAHSLLFGASSVEAGQTIVVHAAAGGVGSMLCQLATKAGARVIGTVGQASKQELARASGCDEVIVTEDVDVAQRIREVTGGSGADIVYDGVGAATFEASLISLCRGGLLVSYGTSSGPIPPFDIFRLNRLGSLHLTSASAMDYTREPQEYRARARVILDAVAAGDLHIELRQHYRLCDARRAHEDLEARLTSGASVLVPGDI